MLKIASACTVFAASVAGAWMLVLMGTSMAQSALSDTAYPRCALFSGACDPQYITQGSLYLALLLGCMLIAATTTVYAYRTVTNKSKARAR